MKRISILLLILSALAIYGSWGDYREFSLINTGNKLSNKRKYAEADEAYLKAIERYSSEEGVKNRAINLYTEGSYEGVLKSPSEEWFIRGNSLVYTAENLQDDKKIQNYKKALEEYKKAMKDSGDINIKKNYEIIAKKLQQEKEKQEKKEQDRRDRDREQDNKNGKDEKKKDQVENQEESRVGNDKPENQREKGSSENGNNDQNNEQQSNEKDSIEEKKESTTPQNQGVQGGGEAGDSKKMEAYTILQRLENDEKQAFKNNERLKNIGGDIDGVSW